MWGWGQCRVMIHPLICYRCDYNTAVFILNGMGCTQLCTCHSTQIWGWEVWGQGNAPVGIRTMMKTTLPVFSHVDKDMGAKGGILWVILGEWGRWGGLTGWCPASHAFLLHPSPLHPLLSPLLPLYILLWCPCTRWEVAGGLHGVAVQPAAKIESLGLGFG